MGVRRLPIYVVACSKFVVLLGPSFATRCWCMLELFVFHSVQVCPRSIMCWSCRSTPHSLHLDASTQSPSPRLHPFQPLTACVDRILQSVGLFRASDLLVVPISSSDSLVVPTSSNSRSREADNFDQTFLYKVSMRN